jgi:hypothetical protein
MRFAGWTSRSSQGDVFASPLFVTLTETVPLSPVFATLTKTTGVGANYSQNGPLLKGAYNTAMTLNRKGVALASGFVKEDGCGSGSVE